MSRFFQGRSDEQPGRSHFGALKNSAARKCTSLSLVPKYFAETWLEAREITLQANAYPFRWE